jgi:hypothetical protein
MEKIKSRTGIAFKGAVLNPEIFQIDKVLGAPFTKRSYLLAY